LSAKYVEKEDFIDKQNQQIAQLKQQLRRKDEDLEAARMASTKNDKDLNAMRIR
jgi:hypothetical protein